MSQSVHGFVLQAAKQITYKNPGLTAKDATAVCKHFTDLRPGLEDFAFNDGRVRKLIRFAGTIPVHYLGKIYNIPVCIWLRDNHPYQAPVVFVQPTSNMAINPAGKYVDADGHVTVPFIQEWKFPGSDLMCLVQTMCILFGEMPPVYNTDNANRQHTSYPQTPVGLTNGSDQAFERECLLCSQDRKYTMAVKHCPQCEMDLCVKCLANHDKFPSNRRHILIDL